MRLAQVPLGNVLETCLSASLREEKQQSKTKQKTKTKVRHPGDSGKILILEYRAGWEFHLCLVDLTLPGSDPLLVKAR